MLKRGCRMKNKQISKVNDNLKKVVKELKEIKRNQEDIKRKLSTNSSSSSKETIRQYLPPRFVKKLEENMGSYKSKSKIGWTTSMPQPPEKLDKFMEEWKNESATNLGEFREELFGLLEKIATEPDNAKKFIYKKVIR